MGEAKRVRRTKPARRRNPVKPEPIQGGIEMPGDVPSPPEGRPPRKRAQSVEDPLADWPDTDAVLDQWLIERGDTEDTPDR